MPMEIRELRAGDAAILGTAPPGEVFDNDIDEFAARDFLADPRNRMVVAIDDGVVVGMVSAALHIHPDRGRPELWIDEVGVAPGHHRRGIGRRMMLAMLDIARRSGCGEAWVLTHRSNAPAMGLYNSIGANAEQEDAVMFTFHLDAGDMGDGNEGAG
ncbi:MAG: acetyltransferase [Chlorobi bacterium]|nr:acetyltransferase [Chlorobiota bacterium]